MQNQPAKLAAQAARWQAYAKALLLLALLAPLLTPHAARACLWLEPTLETMARGADIIAMGTVSEAGADTFTLQVDEYLKGEHQASHIIVNNHAINFLIGPTSCGEPVLDEGGRLTVGNQVAVFLEPDEHKVGASWRFSDYRMAEFILLNGSDVDGRFHRPEDVSPQAGEKMAHGNLGYPEDVAPERVRRDIIALIGDAEAHVPTAGPEALGPITWGALLRRWPWQIALVVLAVGGTLAGLSWRRRARRPSP